MTKPTLPLPDVKRTISRIRLLAESARDERGHGQSTAFEDLAFELCNIVEAHAEQIKRLQNALEHIGNTSNEARIMAVAGTALKEAST